MVTLREIFAQIAGHYCITDICTFSIYMACNRSVPCKVIGLENAYTDKCDRYRNKYNRPGKCQIL